MDHIVVNIRGTSTHKHAYEDTRTKEKIKNETKTVENNNQKKQGPNGVEKQRRKVKRGEKKSGEKKEKAVKRKRKRGGMGLGGRGARVLRRVGPHPNNARLT